MQGSYHWARASVTDYPVTETILPGRQRFSPEVQGSNAGGGDHFLLSYWLCLIRAARVCQRIAKSELGFSVFHLHVREAPGTRARSFSLVH